MAFPTTFADPVLGELTWNGDEDAWCGEVDLTPKHRVGLLIQADSKIVGLDAEAVAKQLASYVTAARIVFQRLREMEWKIRLDVAGDVVEEVNVLFTPAGVTGMPEVWEAVEVAQHLTLQTATLFLGRAMDLRYEGRGRLAGKRVRGYVDHLGGIEFAELL